MEQPVNEQKRLSDCEKYQKHWKLTLDQKAILSRAYCEDSKRIKPTAVVSNVYAIVCDYNLDGICDAYVSSNVEKVDDRRYIWTSYLWDGVGFVRQTQKRTFVFDRIEQVNIDASVCASQDSFFKFDRIGIPSYVMPITIVDGRPELWDYANQENPVRRFRSKVGMSNVGFYCCLGADEHGIANLNDLFLMYSMLVCARRLPCETISILHR